MNRSFQPTQRAPTWTKSHRSIPLQCPLFVKPAIKNNYDWFLIDKEDINETNGPIAPLKWRFIGANGEFMEPLEHSVKCLQ
jgi:hypothetical protein